MNNRNFRKMLETQWSCGNFVCVGLDSDTDQIPEFVRKYKYDSSDEPTRHLNAFDTIVSFNRSIVEATHDLVCAYKLNAAFYEEHGHEGFRALTGLFLKLTLLRRTFR